MADQAAKGRQDLQHLEMALAASKSKLDLHRRLLLSQVCFRHLLFAELRWVLFK